MWIFSRNIYFYLATPLLEIMCDTGDCKHLWDGNKEHWDLEKQFGDNTFGAQCSMKWTNRFKLLSHLYSRIHIIIAYIMQCSYYKPHVSFFSKQSWFRTNGHKYFVKMPQRSQLDIRSRRLLTVTQNQRGKPLSSWYLRLKGKWSKATRGMVGNGSMFITTIG